MVNYIPLIVIVLGLAIMAVFLIRKKSSGHASREKAISELGWHYEKGSSLYAIGDDQEHGTLSFRIRGDTRDIPWEIKSHLFLEINNTSYQPYSVFRCEKELIGNNHFFATPDLQGNIKKDYLSYLPKLNAKDLLSRHNIDIAILEKLKLSETKNDFFNKNYTIYSSDALVPDRVAGKDSEYYLAEFISRAKSSIRWPSIIITPLYMEIKVLWTLEKVEDIKAFANLGAALIKNISSQ